MVERDHPSHCSPLTTHFMTEVTMEPKPYEGYFWQGRRVRLRPLRIEDATQKWREWTDSDARILLEYGVDLPPVSLETYTEELRPSIDFKDTSRRLSFAIDNLEGDFVGWINLSL